VLGRHIIVLVCHEQAYPHVDALKEAVSTLHSVPARTSSNLSALMTRSLQVGTAMPMFASHPSTVAPPPRPPPPPRRQVFRGGDPLQEFKDQGRELFKDLLATARRNAVYSLFIYNPRPTGGAAADDAAAAAADGK
jgi:hypothetical protein